MEGQNYDMKFWRGLARMRSHHDPHHRDHVVVMRSYGLSVVPHRMATVMKMEIMAEAERILAPEPTGTALTAITGHRTNHLV